MFYSARPSNRKKCYGQLLTSLRHPTNGFWHVYAIVRMCTCVPLHADGSYLAPDDAFAAFIGRHGGCFLVFLPPVICAKY